MANGTFLGDFGNKTGYTVLLREENCNAHTYTNIFHIFFIFL